MRSLSLVTVARRQIKKQAPLALEDKNRLRMPLRSPGPALLHSRPRNALPRNAGKRGRRPGHAKLVAGDAPPLPPHLLCCKQPANGATWRSGYAADCKSVHPGSIPGVASIPTKLPQPRRL